MADAIEPFPIRFDEADLADLRRRLEATRLPKATEGSGWSRGIDLEWLRGLLDYWRRDFDWRAVESRLARHESAFATVDGLRVHFLRVRSPHPGALPLVVTHGWPGSILEFEKILGPLCDPVAFGGEAGDAFEVIAPSIPGYGLSQAPRRDGFDVKAVGATMAGLMRVLGYPRYGAQGGDWGAMASSYTALLDPGHCIGLHLNMVLARRPKQEEPAHSAAEEAAIEEARRYRNTGTAYQAVQGLEPDLLGVAMEDSPAALCAWIVSKFGAWSDCGGDIETRFTRDELLANVTWYWLTRSATSAARLYLESRRSGRLGAVESRVEVPTACAIFPREMFRPPRSWAERIYNVQRWTEMKSGGHFAAMEEPQALVEDIRAFFRGLR